MRTTLDLDERLLRVARRRAAERGTSLTAVIEEALAVALAPRPAGERVFRLQWKAHRGRQLPGFDLADRDSLYEGA